MAYAMHLHSATMEDDESFTAATDRRNAAFVPSVRFKREVERADHETAEKERYRNRARAAEAEVKTLKEDLQRAQMELEEQRNAASTYAATTARGAKRPLTHVKPHAPFQSTATRLNPVAAKPLAHTAPVHTAAPVLTDETMRPASPPTPTDKGKSRAGQPLPKMDYEFSLSYDDDEYDSGEERGELRAQDVTGMVARQVRAILSGTTLSSSSGNSGSSSVPGRVEITPTSSAEFDLVKQALEDAHSEGNPRTDILMAAIRRYINSCQTTPVAKRTPSQKSALRRWVVPDWATTSKYDPGTRTVVHTTVTKAELRDRKGKRLTEQSRLFLDASNSLGLTVNGEPDRRLGNISSPTHQDHPLIWRLWAKNVTRGTLPKGLSIGPNGMPYERGVRGFRRLAPLFKTARAAVQLPPEELETRRYAMRAGQTLSMMIIALNGRYESLLQEHGLLVHATPSWEVIEFSPNPDEKECAKHLAERGVSIAEAGDSQQYAHQWLSDAQEKDPDVQYRIQVNRVLENPRAIQEAPHFPDELVYFYHEGYARWMPQLPAPRTMVQPDIVPGGPTEQVNPPSQTGLDTTGLKPEYTAVSSEAPASDISVREHPDDNIEMQDPDIPGEGSGNTAPPP